MKKVSLLVLCLILMLSGCKEKLSNAPVSTEKESNRNMMTIPTKADIERSEKAAKEMCLNIEEHLKYKYNEQFICQYDVYPEEYSIMTDYRAFPKAEPSKKFNVMVGRVGGEGEHMILDLYNNLRLEEKMTAYIKEAVNHSLPKGSKIDKVNSYIPIPQKEVTKELFENLDFHIFITTDNESVKAQIDDQISEIVEAVIAATNFKGTVLIYVDRDTKNKEVYSIQYKNTYYDIFDGYTKWGHKEIEVK